MFKRIGIAFSLLLLLTSCGGDEQSKPDFKSIRLASASAPPFSEVTVEQLPEDIGDRPVYASYRVVGGNSPVDREESYPTIIWRPDPDSGELALTVPFLLDADGGEIEVVITDGERESSPLALQIEPVQVRQGAFEQTASKLETALAESAATVGVTLADVDQMLRADTIPPELLPLAISYHLIADPQNDSSLVNKQHDAQTTELLDAVFTRIDLEGHLDDIISLQRQLDVPLSSPAVNAVTLDRAPYTITGPEELSSKMQMYEMAWTGARDLENFDATVGTYFAVLALLTRSKKGGAALFKSVAESVGMLTSLSAEQITYIKAMFPCCFTEFRTEFSGPALSTSANRAVVLQEDSNAPQVELTHAYASVESEELDLGKIALEKVIGELQSGVLDPDTENKLGEFATELSNDLVVSPAIAQALEDIEGKKFNFRWRNIDLNQGDRTARWLDIEVDQPAFVHDLPNFGSFRATEHAAYAPATSKVRINPNVDSFPVGVYSTILHASTILEMSHIEVVAEPELARGEPGESLPVSITLENAWGLDVKWEAITAGAQVEPAPGSPFEATVHLPDDSEQFPVVVRATSTSTTGLRSPSVFQTLQRPERAAYIHISANEGVFVTPQASCITPGQSEQFRAEVLGPSDKSVDWSSTGGSIDANGVFQANGQGTFEITATSRADSSLSDTARITVGDCRCFAHVTVSGAIVADFGGHSTPAYGQLVIFGDERNGGSRVTLQDVAGFEVGATGTFEARLGGASLADFDSVEMIITTGHPEHRAFLTVTEWDGNYFTADFRMNSTFFGTMGLEDPPVVRIDAKVNGYASPSPMEDPTATNPCDITN